MRFYHLAIYPKDVSRTTNGTDSDQVGPMKFCLKQVAQRETIAHLSPMCQGQISFQKTYKWAMETRGPKIELVRAFMPVLVTSNFDDDSIKNERPSMETQFSHYKSTNGKFFRRSRAANFVVSGPIWPKFELI